VKARGNGEGFATLERWLGDNDALFLRRDRAEPVIVLPWRIWDTAVECDNAQTAASAVGEPIASRAG
jgi:hypothetical protein